MLEKLRSARKRFIGTKQTTKALERGTVSVVFVARDAEMHITKKIIDMCVERGVEIVYVDTMLELGRACGIEVGAASAALLENYGESVNT